jgi:PAS domain S-box-containing protein
MRLICEQSARYLNASGASMSEEDPRTGERIVRAIRAGSELISFRHPVGDSPAGAIAALQAGMKLVVHDALNDPRVCEQYAELYQPNQVAAFVTIPRMIGGRWAGSFVVVSDRPRRWLDDEIELLEAVANLAWLAVEQARAQFNLRISDERFRIALQNTPIVVFTVDSELRYTWIYNPRPEFNADEVLGKRDDELLEAASAEILMAPKRQVLQTGRSLRRELAYRVAGQEVIYDVTLEPLRDSAGRVVGLTAAAMDLTDLRRLEAERIEYVSQMEVQRRLMNQREMERMDIARDLHDGVLQEITAMGFSLTEAMNIDEKETRLERLRALQRSLHMQSQEIRRFCNDLRPPALAPFGLEKAIRSHVDTFRARRPGLNIHLSLQSDRQTLPEESRMALFRIYQEVMNNVVKHSQASEVWITLALAPRDVMLEIRDNGVGFDVPQDWVAQARSGHLGLIGLRERASAINGMVEIESRPGQGARVRVRVPRD